MLSIAMPIGQEVSPSTELKPSAIAPFDGLLTHPLIEDDHLRQKREIPFRPLFAYREQQAHNHHHPVHRRHIIETNPIDNIPIYEYNPNHQHSYSDVRPLYPYEV